jgi:hypothetical protein
MTIIKDERKLEVGSEYKLSGGVFCSIALEVNAGKFVFKGRDELNPDMLHFEGVTDGRAQFLYPERLADGQYDLSKVETIK